MTTTDKGAPEGSARVTDEELGRVAAADVTAPDGRWEFHRIQLGYTDGIPRAVFVEPDDEPVGIPLIWNAAVIMKLAQKLAAEVRAQRSTVAERDAQIARLARESDATEAALRGQVEAAEKLAADLRAKAWTLLCARTLVAGEGGVITGCSTTALLAYNGAAVDLATAVGKAADR
ncbi:MAG: hypothetical protein VW405_15465 [Rhodospirillaceae bacterium]